MQKQIAIPFLLFGLFIFSFAEAQVKIGDNPQVIDPASILELESSDKVLVITRVDSLQMTTIVPNRGALVYNTTADCVFYYDGTQWINMCGTTGTEPNGPLTANPIVNDISTIVITPTANGDNFEIAPNSINSEQIVNGGINGVDIQDGSIGRGKLTVNAVDKPRISENAVGPYAIDRDSLPLSFFTNDAGFITGANIISADAGNVLTDSNGAFYDDSGLQTAIAANTTAIAADGDQSITNEIQTLSISGDQLTLTNGGNTITIPTTNGSDTQIVNGTNTTVTGSGIVGDEYRINVADPADPNITNEIITNAVLNVSNELVITEAGNTWTVPLGSLAGGGGGTYTAGSGLDLSGTSVFSANVDNASIQINGSNQLEVTDGGITAVKLDDMAATTGQVLKWNGTTWAPDADNAGTGNTADTDTDDGLSDFNPTTGYDVLVDDTSLEINASDQLQVKDGGITAVKLDDMAATTGQVLKWNGTTWAPDADNAGTGSTTDTDTDDGLSDFNPTTGYDVLVDDTTLEINASDQLEVKDGGITLDKLDQTLGTANGDIIKWDNDNGNWEVGPNAGHTGAANSIFFADTDGTPTTADDNAFANDDGGLLWDPEGRKVSTQGYGALYVGLDGATNTKSTIAKVQIMEQVGSGLSYALHLQNDTNALGASVGTLFSVEGEGGFGKGALVYERTGGFAVGDFHFLQNSADTNTDLPTLTDKAFTIKNNGDIQLYGNVIDKNGVGATQPPPAAEEGLVLTNTPTGAQWAPASGGGLNAVTASASFTGDGTTGDALDIADDAIGTDELSIDAVITENILDGAVNSAKITNATIALEDLSNMGATTDGQVLKWNQTATTWEIGTDNTAAGLSAVNATAAFTGDGTSGNALDIADDAITTDKILDGEVQTDDIEDFSITTAKMQPLSPTPAADRMLITNTSGDVVWAPALTSNLNNGTIFIGDAANAPQQIALGGDVTMNNLGEVTIANAVVTDAKLDKANIPLSGFAAAAADVSLGGFKITDLAVPTLDQDAATKKYVDDNVGNNLSSSNLVQTEALRTYEVGTGQALAFIGPGDIGFGNGANPPLSKFHFAGEVRVEGVNSSQGSEGSPAYSFSTADDSNTGMYRPAADQIGFSVGGFEALRIEEPTTGSTKVVVNETLELEGQILDEFNTPGTVGQVLTATATGTQWSAPKVIAMGKIGLNGANTNTNGASVTSGSGGSYQVTLDVARPNNNYIVQLTILGTPATVGLSIYVTGQSNNSFDVVIKDSVGTLTDTAWYFTITDF